MELMVRLGHLEKFTEITNWCEETLGPSNLYQPNISKCIYGNTWKLEVVPFEISSSELFVGFTWSILNVVLTTDNPSGETLARLKWL